MSKKIQVLGMSEYLTCVIYDILKDNDLTDHLDIYLNIDIISRPKTPVMEFPYSVYEKGVSPDLDIPVVFGASGPKNKYPIFKYFSEKHGIQPVLFENIIHNSAYVANSSSMAMGGFVEQKVVISSQTALGFGVTIKRGALIGHHCTIGDFVDINPGVVISGKVSIGRGTVIGSGAILVDGVVVGENSFIGAGSVVTKDVPACVIAYGNPCRVIRENTEWKI
jgi:sugar O-acyltransferase (sialic acid O-acetyltransferase NeuD family)